MPMMKKKDKMYKADKSDKKVAMKPKTKKKK